MPIFMEFEGIKGSVTAADHKEWILLESMQWGGGRSVATPTGSGKNREASRLSVSEVVVTKLQDASSRALLGEGLGGDGEGKKVTLHLATTDQGTANVLLKIVLEDTLVSGFSTSGSDGSGRPMESLSLNFTKIAKTFYTQAITGTKGAEPYTTTYDVAEAKAT